MAEDGDLQEIKERIFGFLNNSPFYKHIGMEVLDAGEGFSRMRLQVKKELMSLYGILHGGVIASLLDSSCTIAVGTLLGEDEAAVTVDLRINFISNVGGGTLFGEGKALHKGRYTGVAEAKVRDEKDNLVAVGVATIFILKRGESQVRDAKDPVDERL